MTVQRRQKLTKSEIDAWLRAHAGWRASPEMDAVSKTIATGDFRSALALVNRIGEVAEEARHHPDIVLSYGEVSVSIATHEVQGITDLDLGLADAIDLLEHES